MDTLVGRRPRGGYVETEFRVGQLAFDNSNVTIANGSFRKTQAIDGTHHTRNPTEERKECDSDLVLDIFLSNPGLTHCCWKAALHVSRHRSVV
jgi:hypothetical protein